MIYVEFLRFLLPLVLTIVVANLGSQVLNGGMARMPQATETLAGFGLAWVLVMFLVSTLLQTKQLALVLVDGQKSYRRVALFVLLFGLLLAGILASLALTPLGDWVIKDLHRVGPSVAELARMALLWLVPIPLLRGIIFFYSGLLIRTRRTMVITYATVASMGASILAVFLLLSAELVQRQPIWLPILVTYAGVGAELAVVLWGSRRPTRRLVGGTGSDLSMGYVIRFFWPLALIMVIQGGSRPLINLFVARGPNGIQALAVLTIVYSLSHLSYGWLNEIRNLAPAFRDQKDGLKHIRRFAVGIGLFSFGFMMLVFWTPLREVILGTLLGLSAGLVAQAAMPLVVFSFFPLVVMARAHLHGIGLVEHRTQAMAPSAPARLGAILVALIALRALGIHGATLGVAALLLGFVVETLVVWWGIRGGVLVRREAKSFAE